VRHLPLGTAYAVWTGLGVLGAALAGAALFNEPLTLPRAVCLALIAGGILGLKLLTPG
jgi:quaternary ammonium compound-resistance protein SugE